MLDKVLPTLFVAAISALTFVAYKHPRAYQRIYLGISVSFIALFLGALAWHLASYLTFDALIPFIDANKLQEAKVVGNSYLISPWVFAAGGASVLYLSFLTWLPILLGEDNP
jgi:hypothetical protein